MNEKFFESICQYAGMVKNNDGIYIDNFSNLIFRLENDGAYIKGNINDELLQLITVTIYSQISDDYKLFTVNRINDEIIEIKLDAPTIIGSVNLLNIIDVIHDYYQSIQMNVSYHSNTNQKVKRFYRF